MNSSLTTGARTYLARLTFCLVVATTLASSALGSLSAHASPRLSSPSAVIGSPYITVDDEYWGPLNPHVLPVTGFNFTVNSPVLLEVVNSGGVVITAVVTAGGASSTGALRAGSFQYGLIIPAPVHLPGLRLFAIDEASRLRSNTIFFHLPIPSCIRHPYTCI